VRLAENVDLAVRAAEGRLAENVGLAVRASEGRLAENGPSCSASWRTSIGRHSKKIEHEEKHFPRE
jgi:hypothetical protein